MSLVFLFLLFFYSLKLYSKPSINENLLAPQSISEKLYILLDKEVIINYHPIKFMYKTFPFFSRRMIVLKELGRVSDEIIEGYKSGLINVRKHIEKNMPDSTNLSRFESAIEDIVNFSLNETIPNAIDAIFLAKDNGYVDKDKILKIHIYVTLNIKKYELEIRLEDDGIGIGKKTFERWKQHFNGNPLHKLRRTDYKDMLWRNYIGGDGMGIVHNLLDLDPNDINLFMWGRADKALQPEITFQSKSGMESFEITFPSFSRSHRKWTEIKIKKIIKEFPGTVFISKFTLKEKFAKHFNINNLFLEQLFPQLSFSA